jgi:hypothetical protein
MCSYFIYSGLMQEKPQSERGKDMSHQMTFNLGLGLQHKLAGYTAADLGKAAGSIFTDGKRWEYTGHRRRSARVSNHGRAIRIWRLKDFTF